MKFFGWMQNKLNGKQNTSSKQNTIPVPVTSHMKQEPREEFSDWPHGLLAIGTFGNSELKQNPDQNQDNNIQEDHDPSSSSSDHDLLDFTPEEVGKLQKELTKLLSKKPINKDLAKLPLDRFLNCPSSLEVDRRISTHNTICSSDLLDDNNNRDEDEDEEDIDKTISIILGRCKDICRDNNNNNNKKLIGKKSISFLLKKMFVCRSGFAPQPSLRDTLQESRMEKLLRTMLHKKMHSNSSRTSSMKKYLEDKPMPKKKNEDERKEKLTDDGCKWVKTDSEYIVLEI